MTSAHDIELLEIPRRIRDGDRRAENALVTRFHGRVFLMALARTRDREASRELAQDVLLAVLEALREGRLRDSHRLAGFVFSTARHHIAGYLREAVRRPEAAIAPAVAEQPSPHERLETVERRDLLRRCLEEMSPGDREVLVLTLGEGLNPRDIASRLGLSPEVVRQKKCRATKRILDLVEKLSRS